MYVYVLTRKFKREPIRLRRTSASTHAQDRMRHYHTDVIDVIQSSIA